MKKNSQTPKRKRLTKQARLNAAKSWIEEYQGKSIISGYAKWFGVDKISAIAELTAIGVMIPDDLKNQIIDSINSRTEETKRRKEKAKIMEKPPIDSDENFAFIAGYTSGGFPYGITHHEWDIINDTSFTSNQQTEF